MVAWAGTADTEWRSLRRRLGWVREFRRLVAAHEGELRDLICRETHKTAWEALTADILPLLAACRWAERHAVRVLRPRRLRGGAFWQAAERHMVVREPLGDVAIIATWNYPVQLLGIQMLQALVAGNRVVVKPSEHAPATQERLLRLAVAAGLPEGVLGWVPATREAGRDLLAGRRFDHVVFTGSTNVGRAVAAWAAETLTPTTLELSGRDSAIVLADADTDAAAQAIWYAATVNAGQTCMAPRRVLVERAAYEGLLRAMAPMAAAARPLRLISEAAAARAFGLAREAMAAGARSLSGVAEPPRGAWLRPLAIVDCPAGCELVDGDHFGPVVAVVPVRDVDEAMEIQGRCGQHLAASVFTRRPRGSVARDLVTRLGASNVVFNDSVRPVAHPGVCLGGRGLSGWGVTRGEEGLLAMTRPVCIARTGRVLRMPWTTPPRRTAERIAAFARWWYGAGRAAGAGVGLAPAGGASPALEPAKEVPIGHHEPHEAPDGPAAEVAGERRSPHG